MTARKRTTAAGEPVDPEHDDRLARDLKEDSPTDAKRMKMAGAPGRHEEAQQLNALAAQGIQVDDPNLILGQARALVELDRPSEALPLLDRLGEAGRTPQAALIMGRAYRGRSRT